MKKGEEFFAHYGYSPKTNLPWYRALFKKFASEHPEFVAEDLLKSLREEEDDFLVGESEPNLEMDS